MGLSKIKSILNTHLFEDSYSKYVLKSSLLVTCVPLLSILFSCYSIWVFIETSYSFFVSNGFNSSPLFKDAFYDQIFANLNQHLPSLFLFFPTLFFVGVFLSKLLIRPLLEFEKLCENPYQNFRKYKPNVIEKEKLILKTANIFFTSIANTHRSELFNHGRLPSEIDEVEKPSWDWVFHLQYFIVLSLILTVFSLGLSYITNEIYQGIIQVSVNHFDIKVSKINSFLEHQKPILQNISFVSIAITGLCYVGVSSFFVKTINGVSFAFFRTMKEVMRGNKQHRVYLRANDPGKNVSTKFNNLLDKLFSKEVSSKDNFLAMANKNKLELVTPDGYRISGLSKDQVKEAVSELRKVS